MSEPPEVTHSHLWRPGRPINRRALLGASLLGAAAVATTPLLAQSVTEEEIEATEQEIERVDSERRAAEALVAAAIARESTLQQQLAVIDRDRYLAAQRLIQVKRELETVELEVFDINQSIGDLNDALAGETSVLERKARSLYKAGRTTLLEQVLAADSFASALDRAASLERLLARGVADIGQLRLRRGEIQLRTADLTARLDRQQELQAEAQSIEEELARRSEEQQDLIFSVQKEQAERAEDVRAFERESEAIAYRVRLLRDIYERQLVEEERRRAAEALERAQQFARTVISQQSPGAAGPYIWPLLGLITTEYGGCTFGQCPHLGMDIAASSGTPIVAANDGVVLAAGLVVPGDRRASYGMIVIIAHSETEETLYAHLDDLTWPPPVAPGQFVSRGQTIGFVGLTGWTTGPHLHLEYRVGGAASDPRRVLV
ncbi:MAG: peptidoglycan DD-metalloendopeptidase family protein [Chloroflexi bacterium]|nr:peptidoglycan DD-metalloendopeptidase family protein [Chloroflexota bacterium]